MPQRSHEALPLSERGKALCLKRKERTKSHSEAAKTTVTSACGSVKEEKAGASIDARLQTA